MLDNITRQDISPTEEANLVRIVRQTDEVDGVFYPTPAQTEALERLLQAYIGDIRKAARTARRIDVSDAEMVAVEKFISLARSKGRTNERLAGFVSRAMVNAVQDADAESTAIRIPRTQVNAYLAILRQTDGNAQAAYALCKETANGLDPLTFLAINRALFSESIEGLVQPDDDSDGYDHTDAPMVGSAPAQSPEEVVVHDDLIRYLFTLVSQEETDILRLHYGFTDTRTEALRLRHGHAFDTPLSDRQIAPIVGITQTKTVNNRRNRALAIMRQAIATDILNDN